MPMGCVSDERFLASVLDEISYEVVVLDQDGCKDTCNDRWKHWRNNVAAQFKSGTIFSDMLQPLSRFAPEGANDLRTKENCGGNGSSTCGCFGSTSTIPDSR